MRIIWTLLIASLSFPALAAKPDTTDHPLVSSYEGSKVYRKDIKQYDEYRVFLGWDKEAKEYKTRMLEGKVTRILYTNPPERSVLELYRNYENALKSEGAEILYSCNQANMECTDRYVGATIRTQFGIHGIGNKSGRYMFAKLEQEDQTAYLALSVGDRNTDVHVVEMKKMETGKVTINLEALAEGLDKQGYVIVEGIYFDTDKATLKASSDPALVEVSRLLTSRPELGLYVVGHTDMQGSLGHNMSLSKGRAQAVITALAEKHGIDASRLEAHGVGPLAPQASNTQEDGRAKNRRVVLVAR